MTESVQISARFTNVKNGKGVALKTWRLGDNPVKMTRSQ